MEGILILQFDQIKIATDAVIASQYADKLLPAVTDNYNQVEFWSFAPKGVPKISD